MKYSGIFETVEILKQTILYVFIKLTMISLKQQQD